MKLSPKTCSMCASLQVRLDLCGFCRHMLNPVSCGRYSRQCTQNMISCLTVWVTMRCKDKTRPKLKTQDISQPLYCVVPSDCQRLRRKQRHFFIRGQRPADWVSFERRKKNMREAFNSRKFTPFWIARYRTTTQRPQYNL